MIADWNAEGFLSVLCELCVQTSLLSSAQMDRAIVRLLELMR
jgi:hypothetical protein